MKHNTGFSILLICFFIISNLQPSASVRAQAAAAIEDTQSFIVHLQTPPYQLSTASDGTQAITLPGYDPSSAPGDPALPGRSIHIALPPDALPASVKIELSGAQQVSLPGVYQFAPMRPPVTYQDGKLILSYGEHAAAIVDGKNTAVYQANAWFPAAVTGPVSLAQMRKWHFASLLFTPVQFNPQTGQAQLTTAADLRVSYQRSPSASDSGSGAASGPALAQAQAELADTLMDGEASSLLINYAQARAWYTPVLSPTGASASLPGYAILTTNAIAAGSLKLNAFVANLQSRGFIPQIVTETQYGGLTGQSPNGAAEKMRQWLKNNYLAKNIAYVLLIGNPDPLNGDVPMKMMWPCIGQCQGYQESPTDYFYADLTGDWNKDGDAYFGEYSSDGVSGGVDFAPEVYVGRIPVYTSIGGWGTVLDSILQKIIDYTTSTSTAWRKDALLPMSYSDFTTDGADMGEQMKNDYLSRLGFATTTLYQHRSAGCNSPSVSSANLVGGKVKSLWSANAYGLVTWWGHGNATGAYIGYNDCSDGTILTSYDTSALDNSHPSIVFQNSCSNGEPETANNLGYALLIKGAAATVSASRVSWYSMGRWYPELYLGDNASLGYYFSRQVASGDPLGKALFDIKSQMGPGWGGETWMNLMDFNLYGDPAATLYSCRDSHEPNNDAASATPLSYNQTLSGDICAGGDVDYYTFTGASGDRVVADVDAAVNGSKLDSVISLVAADGSTVLAENDDDALSSDAKLGYILKNSGVYYLKVRAWDGPTAGGPEYSYTLHLYTDNQAPNSVAITSPQPGAWLSTSGAAITVTASDAESGIQQVDFYWHAAGTPDGARVYLGSDRDGSDGWSFLFDTSAEPDQVGGELYAFAYDYAGAGASASAAGLGIDRTPPSGSITLSGLSNGEVRVQFAAADNLSGVADLRVSNTPNFTASPWQPFTTALYVPTPLNGALYAQLRDHAGNPSRILCSNPACPTYFVPSVRR